MLSYDSKCVRSNSNMCVIGNGSTVANEGGWHYSLIIFFSRSSEIQCKNIGVGSLLSCIYDVHLSSNWCILHSSGRASEISRFDKIPMNFSFIFTKLRITFYSNLIFFFYLTIVFLRHFLILCLFHWTRNSEFDLGHFVIEFGCLVSRRSHLNDKIVSRLCLEFRLQQLYHTPFTLNLCKIFTVYYSNIHWLVDSIDF